MRLPPLTSDVKPLELAQASHALAKGGSNAIGQVTLRANETTTTVTDGYMSGGASVWLMPTTANAAGAVATTYISSKANGSFILTHANTATNDRTFDYEIRGT